jgi:Alg9-like mannosyltransferase family
MPREKDLEVVHPQVISNIPESVSRLRWLPYGLLLLFRVIYALLPLSYVHPDEFFQATEVMASDVLNVDSKIPWEFGHYATDVNNGLHSARAPIRSILFPYVEYVYYFALCDHTFPAVQPGHSIVLIFPPPPTHLLF